MLAGNMRRKVGFYKRFGADDGYGNIEAAYPTTPEFVAWAQVRPRLGGEKVLADRLAGVNAVNMTIRYSPAAAQITPAWRAQDEQSGDVYNIRSIIDPDGDRHYLELLCELGVAA